MCGIVGYTGKQSAAPILLEGLSRLEYRGYDSAGLAVRDGEKLAEVVKARGKLRNLAVKTDNGRSLPGTCGIGHTRWATHGEPSQANAHPHVSGICKGSGSGPVESAVVGVHNGIIENFAELKDKLLKNGYQFYSDTDTEVAVKLVDYYYNKYRIGPVDAINRMMVRVRGSYALALMFRDFPGEIYAARKDSPMIIGLGEGETFLASDVPAILKYTRSVYYIGNLEVARICPGAVTFFDLNGDEVSKELTEITWDAEAAEKGGFEHFMIKEIHEEPAAVRDTLNSVIREGRVNLSEAGLTDTLLAGVSQVQIVACGSAWHVGMAAQYVIEDLAGVPVRVELASEFRYRKLLLPEDALVIVISQSGETADSLAALRQAKQCGARTLAIVNVVGSTIAREADNVLYTLAGPEIAVATTKAYAAQLAAMDALAVALGQAKGALDDAAQRAGHILHRQGPRLRHQPRGQPQDEGNQLHPLRGLRRRGAEARHHQPGGGQHAGHRRADPGRPVRKDRQQHGGMQGSGGLPDGPDQLRPLQRRGHRRFHRLRPQGRRPLHGQPCRGAPAAAGVLHQRGQGPGCGQAEESGEERHR